MRDKIRILFIGDVVGPTGCSMLQKHLPRIRTEYAIDGVVVNGENSAGPGRGITTRVMGFFKHNRVDVVTSGNHIWHLKDIYPYFDNHKDLLRPANFPPGVPGSGVTTFDCQGVQVGIINVQGRVFMRELVDDPFRAVDSALTFLRDKTKIIFIDMHAETTSEKAALAYHVDGRVSGVVGTHTHVQTADERILPHGTAFITDLGMVGSLNSLLGMKKEPIIQHYRNQIPVKFVVDEGMPVVLSGAWIEVDRSTGKAVAIERIRIVDDQVMVSEQGEHK